MSKCTIYFSYSHKHDSAPEPETPNLNNTSPCLKGKSIGDYKYAIQNKKVTLSSKNEMKMKYGKLHKNPASIKQKDVQ